MKPRHDLFPLGGIVRAVFSAALLFSLLSTGGVPSASARAAAPVMGAENVLSDGQFVYGPNVGDFNLKEYLGEHAPGLLQYADALYGRAEYFSINPKLYITLFELRTQAITRPSPASGHNPLGLSEAELLAEIDHISNAMAAAYYLHLDSFTRQPAGGHTLPALHTASGELFEAAPDTNAGTYGLMAGLAQMEDRQQVAAHLDLAQPRGFYQVYRQLFGDDPASESNHVFTPQELSVSGVPADLLQLPYPRGESWMFSGVHNYSGGDQTTGFTDASSIDFSPGWPDWNTDTSNMWVVAAAAGVPTKISNCNFKITHIDGWETSYYHLENIQAFSGSIQPNQRIGNIANTLAEATCNGGFASGPHVHFALKKNGALVAIDGTLLSGWAVHSGRWPYDYDHNYMWLEKSSVKKYVGNWLLNDLPPINTCGDCAKFVSDVTVPAGTTFAPAESFTKTWRMQNTGNNTWGDGYQLAFVSGDLLGASTSIPVPATVKDGTADLSVPMSAPAASGNYAGYWRLKNPQGKRFGPYVSVKINVSGAAIDPWRVEYWPTAAEDGWVLESTETSLRGGALNSTSGAFILGDDATNRQFRSILSFDTSPLPDNAVITGVSLRIRRKTVLGTNPFTTHGSLVADVRVPFFGSTAALQLADFRTAPSLRAAATFSPVPSAGWYSTVLPDAAYPYVNLMGTTQFRLRFTLDDDNDLAADQIRFYSGEAAEIYRPMLIVEYHLP